MYLSFYLGGGVWALIGMREGGTVANASERYVQRAEYFPVEEDIKERQRRIFSSFAAFIDN